MPLALHAPLPLPCWPQGARLGPWPFLLLLPLSWQLLAQLQIQCWVQSPLEMSGFLNASQLALGALERGCCMDLLPLSHTTMVRQELEGVCHSWAAPLLPGSSVLGQGYSLHIPEWVRTSSCLTLPHLPCCVLGAGDLALLPCWGHQPPLKLLWWLPAPAAFWGCLCFILPTLLALSSSGPGSTPSPAWPSCWAGSIVLLLQGLGTASCQRALCHCHPGAINASTHPHPPVGLH